MENKIIETKEDVEIFSDSIINPPKANSKLKKAKENHSKNIKE